MTQGEGEVIKPFISRWTAGGKRHGRGRRRADRQSKLRSTGNEGANIRLTA